jgi:hypothetical protein
VHNWFQLNQTNDLSFILINRNDKLDKYAIDVFSMLQDGFIKHFGIDEKYKQYLKLKCDIEIGYIKQALSGDKSNDLLIKQKEQRLSILFSKENQATYFSVIIALEKFLGRKINTKKESTFEFYNYLNEFKQWQKVKK